MFSETLAPEARTEMASFMSGFVAEQKKVDRAFARKAKTMKSGLKQHYIQTPSFGSDN